MLFSCLWKEKEGLNEKESEKDGHKNQIKINIFFLWKLKGWLKKKKRVKKERREDQTAKSLYWFDEGPALGWSTAHTVDTAGRLNPFIRPLFKAKEGNAEVHSHYI